MSFTSSCCKGFLSGALFLYLIQSCLLDVVYKAPFPRGKEWHQSLVLFYYLHRPLLISILYYSSLMQANLQFPKLVQVYQFQLSHIYYQTLS